MSSSRPRIVIRPPQFDHKMGKFKVHVRGYPSNHFQWNGEGPRRCITATKKKGSPPKTPYQRPPSDAASRVSVEPTEEKEEGPLDSTADSKMRPRFARDSQPASPGEGSSGGSNESAPKSPSPPPPPPLSLCYGRKSRGLFPPPPDCDWSWI